MNETILITEKESLLGSELIKQALSRGYRVLTTISSDREEDEAQEEPEARLREVVWNKRSPVSAKTVMLEARRFLEKIDHIVLVYPVEKAMQAFHTMTMEDVEEKVDRKVKGSIFLVREFLRYYQNEEEGCLAFALDQSHSDEHSPLDAAATASFRSFADSILRFYMKDQFFLSGFLSVSPDTADYARFILDTIKTKPQKASGEWLRHSQKQGSFFNSLPIVKRSK